MWGRVRAQSFIKVVNYQHMMPTRYTLDVDLKPIVTVDVRGQQHQAERGSAGEWPGPPRPLLTKPNTRQQSCCSGLSREALLLCMNGARSGWCPRALCLHRVSCIIVRSVPDDRLVPLLRRR